MKFADKLAVLPAVDHLARLELTGPEGQAEVIENKPGSAGSVRVYAYLGGKHGCIDATAAQEGVDIYAEHGEDALLHPGKHPNIDRLFAVLRGGSAWRVRSVPADQ
ncbi:MAG: DUF2322 family protein [Thiobacillus sp.]|nr:DUF2322 family protein [Thiobacillus sp.]